MKETPPDEFVPQLPQGPPVSISVSKSDKERPHPVMLDAKGGGPDFIYKITPVSVTTHAAGFASASITKVSAIDLEGKRCWVIGQVAGQLRPIYGWVSFSDVSPHLNVTATSDLTSPDPERTVSDLTHGFGAETRDLVDGKIVVIASDSVEPYSHPKYQSITEVRRLQKTITGVMIHSKSAKRNVPATVSLVDAAYVRLKAEYLDEGGKPVFKWLMADQFTPPLVVKKESKSGS